MSHFSHLLDYCSYVLRLTSCFFASYVLLFPLLTVRTSYCVRLLFLVAYSSDFVFLSLLPLHRVHSPGREREDGRDVLVLALLRGGRGGHRVVDGERVSKGLDPRPSAGVPRYA